MIITGRDSKEAIVGEEVPQILDICALHLLIIDDALRVSAWNVGRHHDQQENDAQDCQWWRHTQRPLPAAGPAHIIGKFDHFATGQEAHARSKWNSNHEQGHDEDAILFGE